MGKLIAIIGRFALTKYILISFLLAMLLMSIMQLYTFPIIHENANGTMAFDLSPMGYSYDDAKSFLATLSEDGRRMYLYVQEILDLFYPLFLSCFFSLSIYKLTRSKKQLCLIGLLPLAFDYLENIFVIIMLNTNALRESTVMIASCFTISKSIASTICYTMVIILLLRHFVSKSTKFFN